jgi:preprotein translocase subunit YajC
MHLNLLNAFLADATATPPAAAPAGAPGAQPSPAQQLFGSPVILIVLMVVMMYFMMIRPQSQQRKRLAHLLETLKSGDKVVTTSGIVGVVVTVKDKTVSLRSADAKMEMTKSSVVEILERGGDEKSAS